MWRDLRRETWDERGETLDIKTWDVLSATAGFRRAHEDIDDALEKEDALEIAKAVLLGNVFDFYVNVLQVKEIEG